MAFKQRGNGNNARRRNVRDFYEKEFGDSPDFQLESEVDSHLPVPNVSFSVAFLVVAFVSVLSYWNSRNGEFLFDDSEAIVGNKDLRPETPLEKLFVHDFWGGNLSSNLSHKSFRPLVVLTFRLNYWLAGGLKPWGFHFFNIILHAVVSALSLKLYSILFGAVNNMNFNGLNQFTAPRASLLCGLIFAVHPVHTESVAGVVGRADLLCTVCFILSFLCYVQCCFSDGDSVQPVTFSWIYLSWSMALCGLAMLCKEQGITVLGICCVYDVIVVCQIDPHVLLTKIRPAEQRNGNIKESSVSNWIKAFFTRQAVLLFTGLLLLIGRWRVMGSSPPVFQVVDNPASFEKSIIWRVINYNYLYAINAWLLIVPQWLCFDWSMGCVPLIKSLSDPRMLCVICLWTVLLTLLVYCVWGTDLMVKRILTLCLALVVIPFLPASNILFRVGFVVAERVLYLSSLGSSALVVLGFTVLNRKLFLRKFLGFCICVLLVLYAARTIQRSRQWLTEDSLFTAGLSVCPLNAKVHYNVGKVRAEQGLKEEGEQAYREAIRLNPSYDLALNNLGNLIKDDGKLNEAEELLEKAVSITNTFAAGWMNLGTVKAALKKSEEAEKCYLNAVTHRAKYPDAYFNLGNLYIDLNKKKEAVAAFKTAVNLKNSHVGAWINHALLLDKTGNTDEAVSVLRQAEKFIPREPTVYFNLGNMLGQKGLLEEAEKHFLKSLELNPDSADSQGNLGVLYHRWGKHDLAEEHYIRALKLDPQNQNARENLQKLKRTKVQLAKEKPKGK